MNIITKLWLTVTFPVWGIIWAAANGLVVGTVVTWRTVADQWRFLCDFWAGRR